MGLHRSYMFLLFTSILDVLFNGIPRNSISFYLVPNPGWNLKTTRADASKNQCQEFIFMLQQTLHKPSRLLNSLSSNLKYENYTSKIKIILSYLLTLYRCILLLPWLQLWMTTGVATLKGFSTFRHFTVGIYYFVCDIYMIQ